VYVLESRGVNDVNVKFISSVTLGDPIFISQRAGGPVAFCCPISWESLRLSSAPSHVAPAVANRLAYQPGMPLNYRLKQRVKITLCTYTYIGYHIIYIGQGSTGINKISYHCSICTQNLRSVRHGCHFSRICKPNDTAS
jgi:hypothetical protein